MVQCHAKRGKNRKTGIKAIPTESGDLDDSIDTTKRLIGTTWNPVECPSETCQYPYR
jgi:hypothetical protein